MKNKKIAIIGAGPAGAFAAYFLSKSGLEITVFEKSKEIKRRVCGEYLCPTGVKLLQDLNLDKELLGDFNFLEGMIITTADQDEVQCHFPFTEINWHGISLNREIFDQRIVSLAKKYKAEFKFNQTIKNIKFENNKWNLKSDDFDENFDIVLAGDGRISTIARMMEHRTFVDTTRTAIHFYLKRKSKFNSRFGEMHLFADGSYCGIDPINDDEVNVSFVVDSLRLKNERPIDICNLYFKNSKKLNDQFIYDLKPTDIKVITPLTNRIKAISVDEGLAYIGDASGFVDPLTGEGIYNALLSAKLISDSLMKNENIKDAMKEYRIKRKKIFLQKYYLNMFFQKLIKLPKFCHLIAVFLNKKQERANNFVGIIGNIYSPIVGIMKIIMA